MTTKKKKTRSPGKKTKKFGATATDPIHPRSMGFGFGVAMKLTGASVPEVIGCEVMMRERLDKTVDRDWLDAFSAGFLQALDIVETPKGF